MISALLSCCLIEHRHCAQKAANALERDIRAVAPAVLHRQMDLAFGDPTEVVQFVCTQGL